MEILEILLQLRSFLKERGVRIHSVGLGLLHMFLMHRRLDLSEEQGDGFLEYEDENQRDEKQGNESHPLDGFLDGILAQPQGLLHGERLPAWSGKRGGSGNGPIGWNGGRPIGAPSA
jgi:hypothetical protein